MLYYIYGGNELLGFVWLNNLDRFLPYHKPAKTMYYPFAPPIYTPPQNKVCPVL